MKIITLIIHFLGSIYFAILLLIFSVIGVSLGTFIESYADSHEYAVQTIYRHPLFNVLLSLFFVNILVSALLRWPFKKRHLPFLLTHLGLLMIIGGTVIKNLKGLQGNLIVWEGSGSKQLFIPHSEALQIISRDPKEKPINVPLDQLKKGWTRLPHDPKIRWRMLSYAPHVDEHYDSWIKGSKAYIMGHAHFPVHEWAVENPLSIFETRLLSSQPWDVIALRTDQSEEGARQVYLDKLLLELQTKDNEPKILKIPLKEALLNPVSFGGLLWQINLDWETAQLHFSAYQEEWTGLLNTENLKIQTTTDSILRPYFQIQLTRPQPILAFIDDQNGETGVWAFRSDGSFYKESFSSTTLGSLMMYDQGFGGYGIQMHIPLGHSGQAQPIEAMRFLLSQEPVLAPPLEVLKKASHRANVDFATATLSFFQAWQQSPHLLLQTIPPALKEIIPFIDWETLTTRERKTIQWISRLFHQLTLSMRQGEHLFDILEQHHWPFISPLKEIQQKENGGSVLLLLAQQISAIVDDLPGFDDQEESISLLCAYFQLYGLQADLLTHLQLKESPRLTLETSLTHRLVPTPTSLKVEDQRPGLILEVEHQKMVQRIPLAYYPLGAGLKWPILNGAYQLRFQPETLTLPYHIRLRQARQLNYPHSPQTYSYEGDILVASANEEATPFTLSMNHVYETWDGYRFYLSGVQGHPESGIKRAQLAVNYDPVKYGITYPGALILFLGMGLLFWVRPYGKS